MRNERRLLCIVVCVSILLCLLPSTSLTATAVAPEQWLWPLDGCNIVLSNFGYRDLNEDGELDWNDPHRGIDIIKYPQDNTRGMPVRAAKSGTIITSINTCEHVDDKINCGCNGGAGNYIVIQHTDGTYSRYLHMLQEGMHGEGYVSQGETIGYVGTSGWSYGYHLHFEILDSNWNLLNPMPTNSEISIWHEYRIPSDWPSEWTTYIFDAGDPVTFDSTSVTTVSAKTATIFTWVSSEGVSSERGYYLGTSEGTMIKIPVQLYDAGWTRYSLEFNLNETYGDLSIGQQYYFKFYSVVDGTEYQSEVKQFSTSGPSGPSFDTLSLTTSETDARVCAWLNNPSGYIISTIGLQLGESPTGLSTVGFLENIGWTRSHLQYNLSDYFGSLVPGRTYWARYFAIFAGNTYYSDYFNFTTPAAITFDPINAGDISDTSATVSCWMSNDGGKTISSLGFYWNAAGSSKEKAEIISGVQWTRANLVYSVGNIVGTLQPSTTYYFQYYAVANDIEYLSDVVSFTTTAAITFDPISVSDVTYNAATISCWMSNDGGNIISSLGFYWNAAGCSKEQTEIISGIQWTRANLVYAADSIVGALQPSTTYYFQYYAVANGTEYLSDVITFTTTDIGSHTHEYTYSVGTAPSTTSAGYLIGTCSLCSSTTTVDLPALDTSNYDYAVLQTPSCTATGSARFTWKTTTYGTFSFDVTLPTTDHNYVNTLTLPTCVEQGYTTHTCSNCGDSYQDSYVEALGHDFGTWTQTKVPTCTEKGEEKRICSRCDAYETQEVAALGHDLIHHEAQAPTCAEIGWEAYDTCSRCGYTTYVEIKALDHDLIHHEEQKPNCTEIGWKAYDTCSRCDYSTYVEIEALGHDLIHHEAQAPTCTEIGWNAYDTCSRCDYSTYVEKAALDHDYKAVVTAPTCTEKGYTTYTCTRCGNSYVADEVAALEHTPGTVVEENRIDPTCTTNGGFDTVTYCTVCGEELSRIHTDLAALEHNWDDGVIDPTATCTTDGIKTFTCQRCGEKKTETIAAFGHTPGAAVEENRVDPTCTVNGGFDIVTYCSTCGAELSRIHTDLAALEHNWDDGVIDPAATCTTNGIKTFTCRRCAETKTETIAATGHTPGDSAKENEVAAICTTVGSYDIVIRCTICDEILYAEHYEIAALGHDWNDGEVTTPATATTDGVKTFTCKRCGAIRTEAIPATGEDACKHENTHPEHKDATCTEPGYDKMICNKCGAVVSEETIPALGHDLVADEAVAATCAETGLTAGEHCTRCDYKVAQENVPALGHDWNDGEVTTPATATTDGVKTFTCNRCGATKTETIPATGREDKPCDGGPSCPSYKFTDVKAGDWYHEAVDFAVKNGLFNGMSDTTFEPNIPMTRGMLVTVLWRYEGQPEGGTNNFADVKDGEWYAKAVAWAASKGIVNGVGNGKFDPNGKVTREQLAAILYRYSESKGFDTSKAGNLNTFPDAAKVSDWAKTAYSWAVGEGLIGGNVINGKTLLDPQGNATRAQVATILMRFINKIA